jgi:hypothetical protein
MASISDIETLEPQRSPVKATLPPELREKIPKEYPKATATDRRIRGGFTITFYKHRRYTLSSNVGTTAKRWGKELAEKVENKIKGKPNKKVALRVRIAVPVKVDYELLQYQPVGAPTERFALFDPLRFSLGGGLINSFGEGCTFDVECLAYTASTNKPTREIQINWHALLPGMKLTGGFEQTGVLIATIVARGIQSAGRVEVEPENELDPSREYIAEFEANKAGLSVPEFLAVSDLNDDQRIFVNKAHEMYGMPLDEAAKLITFTGEYARLPDNFHEEPVLFLDRLKQGTYHDFTKRKRAVFTKLDVLLDDDDDG